MAVSLRLQWCASLRGNTTAASLTAQKNQLPIPRLSFLSVWTFHSTRLFPSKVYLLPLNHLLSKTFVSRRSSLYISVPLAHHGYLRAKSLNAGILIWNWERQEVQPQDSRSCYLRGESQGVGNRLRVCGGGAGEQGSLCIGWKEGVFPLGEDWTQLSCYDPAPHTAM